MNTYQAKNIINAAMAGHSGAGKTSLAEAMLYLAGASDRRGKVGEGNTVCDYDPEEIRRKTSVSTAVAPFEWKNKKINLLDTPGLFDFEAVCMRLFALLSPLSSFSQARAAYPSVQKRHLQPLKSAVWQSSSSLTVCATKALTSTAFSKN